MRLLAIPLLALAAAGDGCATQQPGVAVQPVTVKGSSFCAVMRRVAPAPGKIRWSVNDTPESIHQMRRINAAVDAGCKVASSPTS